jgi:hypothetical protein
MISSIANRPGVPFYPTADINLTRFCRRALLSFGAFWRGGHIRQLHQLLIGNSTALVQELGSLAPNPYLAMPEIPATLRAEADQLPELADGVDAMVIQQFVQW